MLELTLIASIVSFFVTLVLTRCLIDVLKKRGSVVVDYFKKDKPNIPRPGGYAIIAGISISATILFIITMNNLILAFILSSIIGFVIGYIDDKKIMKGYYKPLGLLASALPLILLNAYNYNLEFPLVGTLRIPILYIALIFIILTIFGNTINSIDVFNGVVSIFMAIASIPLILALALQANYELLAVAITIATSSLAFFVYHKYPSKIFPGDSGALTLGVAYGALAIIAKLEIIAVISLLPAILNSFFFLSTTKKIIEHREIKVRPTILLNDYRIAATKDANAPITLVRLLVAKKPLYEYQIVKRIITLVAFSSMLSIITVFMM